MTTSRMPTRRNVLAGQFHQSIHISSAVVSVLPASRDSVMQRLADLTGVEIHHRSDSKIVIVLEAPDSGAIGSRLVEIASMPGVLSANMVFEQVERQPKSGD